MRRFLICLDGTWNNASREVERKGSRVYRPTNVLKLARAARSLAEDGVQQITYYDAGVGSMNRAPDFQARVIRFVENVLGGGWGAGFEVNIEEAYTFLSNNYESGDEIFIFGFSRGAAQARSLCQLIGWAGGFPPKRDAYYVPRIFTRYLQQRGGGSIHELLQEINGRREQSGVADRVSIVPARVKFLGIWDTVLALGWRVFARHGTSDAAQAFHVQPAPPENADIVRHALAIDEQRHDFQAELWSESGNLEQRWFAGAHSNIGGGLDDDSLANIALKWMRDEASQVGLSFDEDFLKFYRANPVGVIQSKSSTYRFVDTVLWPTRGYNGIRRVGGGCPTIDPSVFKRLNADPGKHPQLNGPYRPVNLLEYLAQHSVYDSNLEPAALEAVKRYR
jgi:uncharacterized protein (DUF2235 family)